MRSPLKCSHEIEFPAPIPVPGDSVYCYKCRDYSTVLPRHVETHTEPFYVRCMHAPTCRYRRYYSEETYAHSLAECHLRRTGHAVEVYLNTRPAMILFGRVMIHENAVTYARYVRDLPVT